MKNGHVIAPDKAAPLAEALPPGKIVVKILTVTGENPDHPPEDSEHWEIAVEYPDGYIKSHQVAKTASVGTLVNMIRGQLLGRHGALGGEIMTKLPAGLEELAGKTLTFGG